MTEEKSIQWLNIDTPSILSGVPEEKKFKSPVIFGTAGESIYVQGAGNYLGISSLRVDNNVGEILYEKRDDGTVIDRRLDFQVRTEEPSTEKYPYKAYYYEPDALGKQLQDDPELIDKLREACNLKFPSVKPTDVIPSLKEKGELNASPRRLDFEVRTVNEEVKEAHQQADDESDAQDIVDMMSGSPFTMGQRVSFYDEYGTIIGFRPQQVLLEFADLTGEGWRDEQLIEAEYDCEYHFKDYSDWKLRGIDKTLDLSF